MIWTVICALVMLLEVSMNVIFSLALIAVTCGLFSLFSFLILCTSPLWVPACFICLPVLVPLALLLKFTRLRQFCKWLWVLPQREPFKSMFWTKAVLASAQ